MRLQLLLSGLCVLPSLAWVTPTTSLIRPRRLQTTPIPSLRHNRLYQSESSSVAEESEENLSPQSRQQKDLERQREEAQEVLDTIVALKNVILIETPCNSTTTDGQPLQDYQQQVDELEDQVGKIESELVPPLGLTMADYQSTMALFLQLPFSVRLAFCEALELENPGQAATDLKRIPEIVARVYQERIQLTPQRLQDNLETAQLRLKSMPSRTASISTDTETDDAFRGWLFDAAQKTEDGNLREFLMDASNKTDDEMQRENTIKNVLGRVTRKEGVEASQRDLDCLLLALREESSFVVASTEPIPGGFLVRGRSAKKKSGTELIAAIDGKLPEDYPCQVSLMGDVTTAENVGFEDADPVLVLLNKDFTPQVSGILTMLSSTTAILGAFVFCVSVFGQNEIVTARLSEANAVNDVDGVEWFTSKVYDVLVPVLAIQTLHDLSHFVVAKSKKMEMSVPTLLPFFGLPFMGSKTDLTSSPPNRNALFDFGVAGPLVGVLASLACFAVGLELTATADAASVQYLPALPVSLLTASTLGGSMVDYFLGGGLAGTENRFITMQDPNTPVFLHPLAIAGYLSLIINAIALLPLGSSDGGRLSQALFGRFGHLTISSFVWFALLVAALFLQRSEILIGAWAINNIVQNDVEVPCRDETEQVSIPRGLVAIGLWCLAILALTPLS